MSTSGRRITMRKDIRIYVRHFDVAENYLVVMVACRAGGYLR